MSFMGIGVLYSNFELLKLELMTSSWLKGSVSVQDYLCVCPSDHITFASPREITYAMLYIFIFIYLFIYSVPVSR